MTFEEAKIQVLIEEHSGMPLDHHNLPTAAKDYPLCKKATMTTEEKKKAEYIRCMRCGVTEKLGVSPFPHYKGCPLAGIEENQCPSCGSFDDGTGFCMNRHVMPYVDMPPAKFPYKFLPKTSPETGREWEKRFYTFCKSKGIGGLARLTLLPFIRSIESSALAQGEKIGAEKERERMLKIQSKRVGASIKKNPKRHSLHSLLTYYKKKKNGFMVKVIQEKLNALKGTL